VSGSRRHPALSASLRRGRISDLDALLALERLVFKIEPLSRRSLRHFLTSPKVTFIVAMSGGSLAGYALVLYPPRSTLARLYSIAVNPNLYGQGLGRRLLAAVDKNVKRRRCRAIRLEVREDDARTIALYEKSGYRHFGKRARYYDNRIHALRFEKPLGLERRRPGRESKKNDLQARIGFHGGHRGPRSRNSVRSRL
jgi:[ribosomal protein S18]-alanine N-acetyltransferase